MKQQFFLLASLISSNIIAMNGQPPQTPKTPSRQQQIQALRDSVPASLREKNGDTTGIGLGLAPEHKAVDCKDDHKATPPPNQDTPQAAACLNSLTPSAPAPAPQLGLKFRNIGAGLGVGHSFDAHIKEVPNIPLTVTPNTGIRIVGITSAGGAVLNALPKGSFGCFDFLVLAGGLASIVAPEKTKKTLENTGNYIHSQAIFIRSQLPSRAETANCWNHLHNQGQQLGRQCFARCCARLRAVQTACACCNKTKLCGRCSTKKNK